MLTVELLEVDEDTGGVTITSAAGLSLTFAHDTATDLFCQLADVLMIPVPRTARSNSMLGRGYGQAGLPAVSP